MNRLLTYINKQFGTPVSTHSLALFRIGYSVISIIIISEAIFFRPLLFGNIEGISRNPFPSILFLYMWLGATILLGIGLFTRAAALVNYLFTVMGTLFFINSYTASFNDDLLKLGGFLMLLMPVSDSFSLDALFYRMRHMQPKNKQMPGWYVLLFLAITLGYLYFPSGITKLMSDMWLKGLGIWCSGIAPYNHWNNFHQLYIDNYWLCVGINWFVIIFELVFIFLLLYRRWHAIIAIIGIGFHLAIALIYAFSSICFGPIIFYSLFIRDAFWISLQRSIHAGKNKYISYNSSNKHQVILIRFLQGIDIRNKFSFEKSQSIIDTQQIIDAGFKSYLFLRPIRFILSLNFIRHTVCMFFDDMVACEYSSSEVKQIPLLTAKGTERVLVSFFVVITLLQFTSLTYHIYKRTLRPKKTSDDFRMETTRKTVWDLKLKPTIWGRIFFGVNNMGVFLDNSYKGKKNIYAITATDKSGKEHYLPLFNKKGFAAGWNRNLYWSNYTFNTVCLTTMPADSNELKSLTKFWADKYHLLLDSLNMTVYRKQFTFIPYFEKGYYQKMMDVPWELEGKILWYKNKFYYQQAASDSMQLKAR
jgi:uncharacterized membrane protein YphA (DoxX/SURF4 family)